MNWWLFPTQNAIINTFLRSLVVIAAFILSGQTWYIAYWAAVVHDAISLVLIRPYL